MRLARNISSSHNANGNMASNYTPGQPFASGCLKSALASCKTLARAAAFAACAQHKHNYSRMAIV